MLSSSFHHITTFGCWSTRAISHRQGRPSWMRWVRSVVCLAQSEADNAICRERPRSTLPIRQKIQSENECPKESLGSWHDDGSSRSCEASLQRATRLLEAWYSRWNTPMQHPWYVRNVVRDVDWAGLTPSCSSDRRPPRRLPHARGNARSSQDCSAASRQRHSTQLFSLFAERLGLPIHLRVAIARRL